MTKPTLISKLEALDGYVLLSDVARRDFHAYWSANLGVDRERGLAAEPEFFARMSLWYSTLWVLAEGWQQLKIADSEVDAVLTKSYAAALRKFRNKTFHRQDRYPHPDLIAYVESENSVARIYRLDEALKRAIYRALTRERALADGAGAAPDPSH